VNRIPSLDGLRAVSILLVIFGHLTFEHWKSVIALSYGILGVRFFFIISGYLITSLLLQENSKAGTINLSRFYFRRAFRIFPAAIVYMGFVFTIYWSQLRWYDLAASVLYIANFDPLRPWFLGHLWSLGVEEQFYLLWPGVLKKWYARRVPILVAIVLLAPCYSVLAYLLKVPGVSSTFPAVADNLAVGCLLAIFFERIPAIKLRYLCIMVTAVILIPRFTADSKWHTLTALFLLWPLLYVSIAGITLHVIRKPPRILNTAPVVWLGRISYSVYLWQQLFSFTPKIEPWYWSALPVLVGSASYYFVEKPSLRLRELRTQPLRIGLSYYPSGD